MVNVQIYSLQNLLIRNRLSIKYHNDIITDMLNNYHYVVEIIGINNFKNLNFVSQIYFENDNCLVFFNNLNDILRFSDYFDNQIKITIQNYANNYFNNFTEFANLKNKLNLSNLSSKQLFVIMGILNVTPDSFSDGGKYYSLEDSYNHFNRLINNGAEIIDIGGESSRPGASEISVEEEISRTIPIIKKILEEKPETIISIDTKKSKVAEQALLAGAKIVNDISAFNYDKNMLDVLKEFNPVYILMHMKGTPKDMQKSPFYEDPVNEIKTFFKEKIEVLNKLGVNDIILDPGIGFGKRVEDNMEIINRLDEFRILGYPIMIGLSKKSFLGKITNSDVNDREIETIILETLAVNNGANFIRTHEVANCIKLKLLFKNYKLIE